MCDHSCADQETSGLDKNPGTEAVAQFAQALKMLIRAATQLGNNGEDFGQNTVGKLIPFLQPVITCVNGLEDCIQKTNK